jgi:hypothetical protein
MIVYVTIHGYSIFHAFRLSVLYFQFGIKEKITFDDFNTWSKKNSPHLFCGVHNWVYQILTGSKMPSELVNSHIRNP